MSLKYEVPFDDTTGLPPKVKVVAIACAFTAHSIPKNFMVCCHELVNREKNGPEFVTADNFALFYASRPLKNDIILP